MILKRFMLSGYALLLLGLVAFGTLGILHKVADHPGCRPRMIALILYFWAALLTTFYTAAFNAKGLECPHKVLWIGGCAGAIAGFNLFIFQTALRHGKISTSWLIINLAISVPILLSVFLFGEKASPGKATGIFLVLAAIIMMWWDKKMDLQRAGVDNPAAPAASRSKWIPLMMVAFVGQGLVASSQKVLVEANAGAYVWQFYVVLYWSGFLALALVAFMREPRPNRRELATGLFMAVCSVVGNVSITMALNTVNGVVAFPVSNGGSLTMVVLAGVLFFKEKIHPIGLGGIFCGITAILVLLLA